MDDCSDDECKDMSYSAEIIQQLLRCPICLGQFKNPKQLPCQHTFCQACLETVANKDDNMGFGKIRCPQCRTYHILSRNKIAELPNNLTILGFLELSPDPVSGVKPVAPLNAACGSCAKQLCESSMTCCPHCDDVVCHKCSRSHFTQLRFSLLKRIQKFRNDSKIISAAINGIGNVLKQLNMMCDEVKTDINECIERVVMEIRARQKSLCHEVDVYLRDAMSKLHSESDELEVELASRLSFCASADSVLDKNPMNIHSGLESLMIISSQCTEYSDHKDIDLLSINQLRKNVPVNFIPRNGRQLTQNVLNFGEITFSNANSCAHSNLQRSIDNNTAPRKEHLRRRWERPSSGQRSPIFQAIDMNSHDGTPSYRPTSPELLARHHPQSVNNAGCSLKSSAYVHSQQQTEPHRAVVPARSENSEATGRYSPEEDPGRAVGNVPNRAALAFDIDLNASDDGVDEPIESPTLNFRYSTSNSNMIMTPRNAYHQRGRALVRIGERNGTGIRFTWPRGVAVSPTGDRIFVADSSNHRVHIFNDNGQFVKTFGSYGQCEGEFDCPTGIATNSHNEVIVSDRYNHRLVVFDTEGTFKYSFGSEGSQNGQLNCPWGVAVDMLDNIYVCDKENCRVQIFQRNGVFIRMIGHADSGPGALVHPHYLAVAPVTQRIYVTDSANHKVHIFSAEGEFISSFGTQGTRSGQMKHPRGITIDEQGFIILADSGNNRVQVFRQDGTVFCQFGSWGTGNGQFKGIEGLAVCKNGNVIVVDRENHRVQIF